MPLFYFNLTPFAPYCARMCLAFKLLLFEILISDIVWLLHISVSPLLSFYFSPLGSQPGKIQTWPNSIYIFFIMLLSLLLLYPQHGIENLFARLSNVDVFVERVCWDLVQFPRLLFELVICGIINTLKNPWQEI
jgi:hypothetical protein